jgi:hypothetical protein
MDVRVSLNHVMHYRDVPFETRFPVRKGRTVLARQWICSRSCCCCCCTRDHYHYYYSHYYQRLAMPKMRVKENAADSLERRPVSRRSVAWWRTCSSLNGSVRMYCMMVRRVDSSPFVVETTAAVDGHCDRARLIFSCPVFQST